MLELDVREIAVFQKAAGRIRARELLDLAHAANPSKEWIDQTLRRASDWLPAAPKVHKISGTREQVARRLKWLRGREATPEEIDRHFDPSGGGAIPGGAAKAE